MATKEDPLHIEEPITPVFADIDPPRNPYIFNTKGRALDYIGGSVRSDHEGNLIGIRLTTGVWATTLKELWEYSSPGDCIVIYSMISLDIMIKTLGSERCRDLYNGRHVSTEGIQVHYTPSRLITLWAGKRTIKINSLRLWFRQYNLDEARSIVGMPPSEVPEEIKTLELWSKLYSVTKTLWEMPNSIYAPSLISKPALVAGLNQIDTQWIPLEVQEMAYNCIHTPWIDVFMRGNIKQAYDHDLNSAYPYEIAELPTLDYTGGTWEHSSEYLPGASYGFCQAVITINEGVNVSPIKLRYEKRLYSPTGTWIGFITKSEIDFIHAWRLGHVEVFDGWWFKMKKIIKPFRRATLQYLHKRVRAKIEHDVALSYALKMSAASIYGRFLQKMQDLDGHWEASPSFCPVYACIIMTSVKIKLAGLVMLSKGTICSTSVDGFLSTKPLSLDVMSKVRGGIKLVSEGSALVAGPLLYNMEGRRSVIDLRSIIRSDPNNTKLTLYSPRWTTLCEGLSSGKFEYVGREDNVPYQILVGSEYGRRWDKRPIIASQLLQESFESSSLAVEDLVWPSYEKDY